MEGGGEGGVKDGERNTEDERATRGGERAQVVHRHGAKKKENMNTNMS